MSGRNPTKLVGNPSSVTGSLASASRPASRSQAGPDKVDRALERSARRAFEEYEAWTGGRRAWADLSEEKQMLWWRIATIARSTR